MGLTVLVCGGREYRDSEKMNEILSQLEIGKIINGGALGADSLSSMYARANSIELKIYPAQWKIYGKRAGYIRNQQMLDNNKIDLVVAFPGGTGTADMVRRARSEGVEVMIIT